MSKKLDTGNYIYKNEQSKQDFINGFGNEYAHKEYYGKNGFAIDRIDNGMDGFSGNAVIICRQEWQYFKKAGADE